MTRGSWTWVLSALLILVPTALCAIWPIPTILVLLGAVGVVALCLAVSAVRDMLGEWFL